MPACALRPVTSVPRSSLMTVTTLASAAWVLCAVTGWAVDPPWYENRADLLWFQDDAGALQPVRTPGDWARRVAHLRANMELVMGRLPEPSRQPLDVQVGAAERLRHYTRQHVTFSVEGADRLPGWLLIPHVATAESPRPAMLCLPGSSAPGKDRPAGLTDQAGMAYAHELAERGYVCLVLDYPLLHTAEYTTDPYSLGYVSATMKGIVNHRRGIDLLQSLPYVDSAAVGVIGHSLGGHNALFLAVFDERVRAIVSSCGFNVFAKHAGGDVRAWSSRYYMPRISTVYHDAPEKIPFDFTEVLAALAPRPVFVNAPLHDAPDFEVSGVRDCLVAAEPVYRILFQAGDQLVARHPDAGHAFPVAERVAAYAFLDQQLDRSGAAVAGDIEDGLIGHWPSVVEPVTISATEAPRLGSDDFTIAMWARAEDVGDRLSGDLVSRYDPRSRRGFLLTLKTNAGATSNLANWRHLQFGIDADVSSGWKDCGRPGDALFAFALATHEGHLYAGTCEPGKEQSGRVYRHAGGQRWIDCGAPDGSNSVTALAVYHGHLYAATGRYRVAGSSLPESENQTPGGRIFRYAGGSRWIACGQLPDTEAVGGLTVFRGRLYATSLYQPPGFFRYESGETWTRLPAPIGPARDTGEPGPRRVQSLTVFEGFLYATSYDGGRVYRFDGEAWTDCGQVGDNTQTYAFAPFQGKLHVATWPSGRVFRFEGLHDWADTGRLGEELEVMGMLVHNGRFVAGTLPLAEVYQYRRDGDWQRLDQLDRTPDVKYRRAWTMAEHDGQVFCSTLPSGRIHAFSAGQQTQWGHTLSPDWHHVAAVRAGSRLTLYVDGQRVSQTPAFPGADFVLDADAPLQLGTGVNGHFQGALADVRLYRRGLSQADITELALPGKRPPPDKKPVDR